MKKIFVIFIMLPLFTLAQKTYVPDDAFEQALINLDLDDIFDDSVYTSAIDTLHILDCYSEGIVDLTGIENFNALTQLRCYDNQLHSLDLSNNPNLEEVNCRNNQLTSLSVKNGNLFGLFWVLWAKDNPNLLCVEVDDVTYANYTWEIDNTAVFSTSCDPINSWNCVGNDCLGDSTGQGMYTVLGDCQTHCGVSSVLDNDNNSAKELIKVVDLFGREVLEKGSNIPLLYIYDDGTVEKKIVIGRR